MQSVCGIIQLAWVLCPDAVHQVYWLAMPSAAEMQQSSLPLSSVKIRQKTEKVRKSRKKNEHERMNKLSGWQKGASIACLLPLQLVST